jgi:hypothetical protein
MRLRLRCFVWQGRRRLSLIGTGDEGKSLVDAASTRRSSVAATATNDLIKSAPADEKPALLVEEMRKQAEGEGE